VPDLAGYQSAGYARLYAEQVMDVARVEAERGAPGETGVAEAFAQGLHKLMAYKDEYEVARLHLDAVERARIGDDFGEGAKVWFMLHPPLLRALGLKRKLKLGRWFVPAFRALRAGRRLRGTPLDPFGLPKVRRVERALIGEYSDLVARAMSELTPATHDTVARIAGLPDVVRGYEDIKLRNVERFRAEAERLERELAEGAPGGALTVVPS
jgi:indolepyruvate ferredoxin oxidoreductase